MSAKKKILLVRPTLGYGGADRVTLNLLKGFDRDQFDCDLALMRAEGEFVTDLPKDVKLIDLKAGSLWNMWLPLKKLIRSTNYDVLYSTCGGASMPMMLAAWVSGYRGTTVVSERNVLFPSTKGKTKRRLMLSIKKFLFKKATWVTAVSKGVAQECIDILGIAKDVTLVVNNPIINDDLLKGKQESIDNTSFNKFSKTILAVGRFDPQKDYDTLFEAFTRVIEKQPDTGLFILGKGPLENYYREKSIALGIQDHVEFAGFDKNPFKYLAACDVYVLSSRHEGMPGVLVQAMACGAACVSTDCPTGPNELIKSGENGFLVPVGDIEKLSNRISQLLIQEDTRKKFKTEADRAVIRFHEKAAVDSYFNFL